MSSPGKVLVTGASGFVGSAVARKLLERGFSVRALVRPTSPRFHLEGLDLEYAEGDLREAATVRPAMAGVRYLFHVAADYRLWAPDSNEIVANNLNSTRIVMEEAVRAGVERVVYTSSVATLAVRTDGTSVDETAPLDEAKAIGAYKRSKVAAERLVERMIAEHKLPAVIVNPSTPIGPRDVKPTPTGRIIVEAARGRIPAFVDTGLNLVHVDDVADGHLAALDRGKIGERYILGGQNVQFADMLAAIATLVGRRPPRMRMPRGPIVPLAIAAETVARFTKREPFVTLDALRMSKYRMFFTTAKAERQLGLTARPFTQALADAIDWFRGAGYIRH
ncbi:MAG TPA: hopanoid-associated sugar epimerase [Xanthobacteraceae bacterium]|nr:hopanoid-associated sugar epimerase [Xanthobacteraceae bacterium]